MMKADRSLFCNDRSKTLDIDVSRITADLFKDYVMSNRDN